jgi:hypothetical protein
LKNDANWDDSKAGGKWVKQGTSTNPNFEKKSTTVTDSTQVLITDAGRLDIEQTVIDQGENTKHIILTLDGPHGDTTVSRSQLQNRLLWSYLQISSSQYIDATWRTYSMKQYERTRLHTSSGTSTDNSPPHVPHVYAIGADRKPTVETSSGTTTDATVIGYQGYNVDTAQAVQPDVSFTPKQPIAYNRIVIANAPSAVDSVLTLHGQSIPVSVDTTKEYRQPKLTISETGDENRLKIHVEDPVTGSPLTGRRVKLFGANPASTSTDADGYAITDAAGDVYATRTNTYVEARVERDDWRRGSGSVFYDESSTAATFLPETNLVARSHSLVLTLVMLTPLIFMYFYIRQFGFFE